MLHTVLSLRGRRAVANRVWWSGAVFAALALAILATACEQTPPPDRPAGLQPQDTLVLPDHAPEALVAEYARRDSAGEFRGPTEWLAAAYTWPGPFGGDAVVVVAGYEIQPAAIEDSVATVTVTYDVVGDVRPHPTTPGIDYVFDQSLAGRQVVSFTVVHTDAGWRIASPPPVPHISVDDALEGFTRVLSEEDVARLRTMLAK